LARKSDFEWVTRIKYKGSLKIVAELLKILIISRDFNIVLRR